MSLSVFVDELGMFATLTTWQTGAWTISWGVEEVGRRLFLYFGSAAAPDWLRCEDMNLSGNSARDKCDCAPVLKARSVKDGFNVVEVDWPAQNLSFNTIKHLWDDLERPPGASLRVSPHKCFSG